jgi:hypothetical protein
MTELIETAPHEFNAQYNFDGGLDGFFAVDRAVKDGGGTRKATVKYAGERWRVTLYYQDSNIVNPGERTPAGTLFRLDTIREFRVSVEAVEDDDQAGEKGFNAHIRPRWDKMRTEDDYGDERTHRVPFEEGVNVHLQGSNIEFQTYLPLFHRALSAVDVNARHFDDPHDSSTVQQAERYVRIHKDESGPVHARDGPLARLGHLLEGDRDGRRAIEQTDVAEDGEQVPGYRHQVGLDEQRVREVFPDHSLPKRWKHYRARESHNIDTGPLQHPKVGCIYYGSLWRDRENDIGVEPDDLSQLTEELEDGLLSILYDAGLDVTTPSAYVADDYFSAEVTDRDRQVVDLPLEDIKSRQESVVMKHVADGLSPVEWQALETLVTDGGEVSPEDIADDGGFHRDSVYRALDRIDDLVERKFESVQLQSTYVGELVHDAVRQARDRTRQAVEAGAKALEAAERGLDERTATLVAYANRYCENFRERDDSVELDFGTIEAESRDDARREVKKRLRKGTSVWRHAKNDMIPWRAGRWRAVFEVPKHDLKTLRETHPNETKQVVESGQVWQMTDR